MIYRRRPLYSACAEDSVSELTALEIRRDDTVVAVCAGGGRVLSLLTAEPDRIIAIDRLEDQLFQLELKAAAIDALEYDDFAGFIGLASGAERRDVYMSLRGSLSPTPRRYWDRRLALVDEGVLYAGRGERAMSGWVRWLRRAGVLSWAAKYFEATDLAEQLEMIHADGDRVLRHEWFWRLYCQPVIVYAVTQDPGFLHSTHGSVGRYLQRRFVRYALTHLFAESHFLHLLYFGGYPPHGPLPPYLQRDGFERAKKQLNRLAFSCGRIEDFVGRVRAHGRIKWSLSDISSWMSERSFHDLVRGISVRGAPGSRLCFRNFVVHREIPADLRPRVRRLDALCDRVDREDLSVFYRVHVGEYGATNVA